MGIWVTRPDTTTRDLLAAVEAIRETARSYMPRLDPRAAKEVSPLVSLGRNIKDGVPLTEKDVMLVLRRFQRVLKPLRDARKFDSRLQDRTSREPATKARNQMLDFFDKMETRLYWLRNEARDAEKERTLNESRSDPDWNRITQNVKLSREAHRHLLNAQMFSMKPMSKGIQNSVEHLRKALAAIKQIDDPQVPDTVRKVESALRECGRLLMVEMIGPARRPKPGQLPKPEDFASSDANLLKEMRRMDDKYLNSAVWDMKRLADAYEKQWKARL